MLFSCPFNATRPPLSTGSVWGIPATVTPAHAFHCRSIALPLMFSGGTHLARATALTVVCRTVQDFERHHPGLDVTLVLYKEGIYHLAQLSQ